MNARLMYYQVDAKVVPTLMGLEKYVHQTGLEESLLELVKIRASQLNGCAYCLDMHFKDAIAIGETLERLYMVSAWEESPLYTERERAALRLTEAVTRLDQGHVSDEVYAEVRPHFDDADLVALTMAIIAINSWNRLNVTFRTVPGGYQSQRKPHAVAEA
jgi:AhpD family alkylhydroperoxidase